MAITLISINFSKFSEEMLVRLNKYQFGKLILLIAICNSSFLLLYFISHSKSDIFSFIDLNYLDNLQYVVQFTDQDNLCAAVSRENTLVVGQCHTSSVKQFVFNGGVLRSPDTGYCVKEEQTNWRLLHLSTCQFTTKLMLINNSLVQQTNNQQQLSCVTATHRGRALSEARLGATVALVPCSKAVVRASLVLQSKILDKMRTPAPVVTLQPEEMPCVIPACGIVGRFRIGFSNEGRCLGVTEDNKLVVSFCNPRENQAFFYSKGTFMFVEKALCIGVSKSKSKELILTHCADAARLLYVNNELRHGESRINCISALTKSLPTSLPELGAKVAVVKCQRPATLIELLEETDFLIDRAALMLPLPHNESCPFPACAINKRPAPPELLPEGEIRKCGELPECLTVVVKTARRPYFVVRLAQSVKENLHPDVPIIVVDDGPEQYSPEIMEHIEQFQNLKYIIGDKEDLGIAAGRTIAVRMVETRYFLNLDDDHTIPQNSGIAKMIDLMDRSDLSVVGAKGKTSWAGLIDFLPDEYGRPILRQLHGTCVSRSQLLYFSTMCHRCDLTINTFLARTQDVVEVGGWSKELKIIEHVDIFLRLKAAGKKVANCNEFHSDHNPSTKNLVFGMNETASERKAYRKLRWNRTKQMGNRFLNHWNIYKFKKVGGKGPTNQNKTGSDKIAINWN